MAADTWTLWSDMTIVPPAQPSGIDTIERYFQERAQGRRADRVTVDDIANGTAAVKAHRRLVEAAAIKHEQSLIYGKQFRGLGPFINQESNHMANSAYSYDVITTPAPLWRDFVTHEDPITKAERLAKEAQEAQEAAEAARADAEARKVEQARQADLGLRERALQLVIDTVGDGGLPQGHLVAEAEAVYAFLKAAA